MYVKVIDCNTLLVLDDQEFKYLGNVLRVVGNDW